MRGSRVKALRREFKATFGRPPEKAETVLTERTEREKMAYGPSRVVGIIRRWFEMTVKKPSEIRQLKRRWKRRLRAGERGEQAPQGAVASSGLPPRKG